MGSHLHLMTWSHGLTKAQTLSRLRGCALEPFCHAHLKLLQNTLELSIKFHVFSNMLSPSKMWLIPNNNDNRSKSNSVLKRSVLSSIHRLYCLPGWSPSVAYVLPPEQGRSVPWLIIPFHLHNKWLSFLYCSSAVVNLESEWEVRLFCTSVIRQVLSDKRSSSLNYLNPPINTHTPINTDRLTSSDVHTFVYLTLP